MPKLRLTITCVYDADPTDYAEDDPAKMAAIDEEQFIEDSDAAFDLINLTIDEDGEVSFTVEPIDEDEEG